MEDIQIKGEPPIEEVKEQRAPKRAREARDPSQITLKTLINHMKKTELIQLISPKTWNAIATDIAKQLQVQKVDVRTIKQQIAENPKYTNVAKGLQQSPLWTQAMEKYQRAIQKMREAKPRALAVRKGMSQPRKQYMGCLASKLKPSDYRDCLDTYNTNPAFEKAKLVPKALKSRAYEQSTDRTFQDAVAPSLQKLGPLSYLPPGYRRLIEQNPEEFAQYYDDLKVQRQIMNAILQSMKPTQLERLKTYMQENKRVNINQLNEIIGRGERSTRYEDDNWSDTDSILGYDKDLDLARR
jgi:hypothetical protein